MKPTVQISQPVRGGQSQRPQGHNVGKSPVTDWSFQSAPENVRSAAAPLQSGATESLRPSLYTLTAAFDATASRESRFEAAFFGVIVALGAWPIALALHMAVNTVG